MYREAMSVFVLVHRHAIFSDESIAHATDDREACNCRLFDQTFRLLSTLTRGFFRDILSSKRSVVRDHSVKLLGKGFFGVGLRLSFFDKGPSSRPKTTLTSF